MSSCVYLPCPSLSALERSPSGLLVGTGPARRGPALIVPLPEAETTAPPPVQRSTRRPTYYRDMPPSQGGGCLYEWQGVGTTTTNKPGGSTRRLSIHRGNPLQQHPPGSSRAGTLAHAGPSRFPYPPTSGNEGSPKSHSPGPTHMSVPTPSACFAGSSGLRRSLVKSYTSVVYFLKHL